MNRDTRRTRVVLALLLLASIIFVSMDVQREVGSPLDGLRGAAAAVFGPVEQALAGVSRPVVGLVRDAGRFADQRREIDRLTQQNQDLQRQLRTSESELVRRRVAELDRLLRVAGLGQYRIVPAQVIAIGSRQGFERTATIDAGSRDGIRRDMTVLEGGGLVGRVRSVGPTSATVLLAADPASTVGARLEGSMEIGVLTGGGRDDLKLELLDSQAPVKRGDRVVTFGSQGDAPFVPGVPIGVVSSVRTTPGELIRTATVRPYVRFTALDLVGVVVQPPRTDPRDSVLPPRGR